MNIHRNKQHTVHSTWYTDTKTQQATRNSHSHDTDMFQLILLHAFSAELFIIESIRLHVFTFYTRSLHEIQCSFARVGCWYVVVFCVMVLVFYLLLVVRSFSCFECCCLLVVASVLSFECICTCGLYV